MTAFGKLIRTTAFRLTLVYLFLFALFAASLLGYFAWNTRRLITEQITTTVNAETGEISDIFGRRGLRGLVLTIENRALRPGANLYLVTTPAGQAIAGNVGSLAPGVMATSGWSETAYRRLDEQDTADHRALVRVQDQPGIYGLAYDQAPQVRQMLAVNPSERESDLTYFTAEPDILKAWTQSDTKKPAAQAALAIPASLAAADRKSVV